METGRTTAEVDAIDTTARTRFDEAYYWRFYLDPKRRAATPHDARRRARFIAGYLRYLQLPVTRILDLGCGLGRLLRALGREYPRARLVGVEASDYLCERYGWQKGSVVDFEAAPAFDLVVCHDVIQYLDDALASAAIENLARLSRGAVALGILTREDWHNLADQERTDTECYLRPTRWYRRRLAHRFTSAGGGLYLAKPEPVAIWSLERATD